MSLFNKNRIVLISGNDGTDVRIGKVCRSLSKMGFDLHYIGWDRRPESEKSIDLGLARTHIIKEATYSGRFSVGQFARFAQHIIKSLWQLRPNTVCCVDEEYSLFVMPMRCLFYRYLVCDVFDALYDRHSHRSLPVRNMLRVLSYVNRTGVNRLIATDSARYERFGRFKPKCVVVGNYPEDPGVDISNTVLDGPIRIYAAGSMSVRRGLRQLIQAVDTLGNVQITSAGWLYDDYARDVFAKHPFVSFHGIVTASESLHLAAKCDAIFAFYEPDSLNNLLASPNKVYDAMSVGRPVIINEEAGVSQWVVDNHVGFRAPYSDIGALEQILGSLVEQRKSLPDFSKHSRHLYSKGYSWEAMEPILSKLYNGLR